MDNNNRILERERKNAVALGKYVAPALRKPVGQIISQAFSDWMRDVRAMRGNEDLHVEVSLEVSEGPKAVATFRGPAALLMRAVGCLIEYHGDKIDTDRLPEAAKNPWHILMRGSPPIFDPAAFPEGASNGMPDTCYDNPEGPVVVIPGNRWLPLPPALYCTEWGCNLGAGKPVLTNHFKGDLYDATFCAWRRGRIPSLVH
jgi:hypothetical protein